MPPTTDNRDFPVVNSLYRYGTDGATCRITRVNESNGHIHWTCLDASALINGKSSGEMNLNEFYSKFSLVRQAAA